MKEKRKTAKYEEFHKNTSSQKYVINRNNFTYRIILDVIDKYLNSSKDILDIGCGAGTLCLYAASKGNNVYGIDIAHNSITACKKSARQLQLEKRAKFEVMDFPKEVPKGKFDLIFFFEVIEHLKDDQKALNTIHSLLKKGGIAIISTPSKNAPMYKMGKATEFDKRVGHLRRYTIKELVDQCKKEGFEILETKKTEGILRNYLYLNPIAGKFIRFIKFFMVDVLLFLDTLSMKVFGESDLFVIIKKK